MESDSGGMVAWLGMAIIAALGSLLAFVYSRLNSSRYHRGKVTSSSALNSNAYTQTSRPMSHKTQGKPGHRKVRNQRPEEPPQRVLPSLTARVPIKKIEKDTSVDMKSSTNLQSMGSSNSSPVHSPYAPQPKTISRNGTTTFKGVKSNHLGTSNNERAQEEEEQAWYPVSQMRSIMSGRPSNGTQQPLSQELQSNGHSSYERPARAERNASSSQLASTPKRETIMSISVIEMFAELASQNSDANVETVGLLGGSETDDGKLLVTHLILPPQHGTHDSCEVDNYEIVLNTFMEQNLLQVGWIHTHPGYRTFLSSVDLHNHVAQQKELSEYFAIVYSPKYDPHYEAFSVTDAGLKFLSSCPEGLTFHEHHTDLQLYKAADHVIIEDSDTSTVALVDRREE